MKVNVEGKKITSDNWKQGLLKFMINRAVDRKHHYAETSLCREILLDSDSRGGSYSPALILLNLEQKRA